MRPCNIVFSVRKQSYFFALRFNVCHKKKCGIDEDIPKHQLAFNYFADKNSTVNKKESKIKS